VLALDSAVFGYIVFDYAVFGYIVFDYAVFDYEKSPHRIG
jgi:hypothetical protein